LFLTGYEPGARTHAYKQKDTTATLTAGEEVIYKMKVDRKGAMWIKIEKVEEKARKGGIVGVK